MAISIFASCQTAENQNTETTVEEGENRVSELKNEVMESHDRTMEKMGRMGQLRRQLEEASVGAVDSAAMFAAHQELQRASDEMMQWMRSFQGVEAMPSEEEKVEYLKQEKAKMEAIENRTNNAIKAAEELLVRG